jgi:hypothetical protein
MSTVAEVVEMYMKLRDIKDRTAQRHKDEMAMIKGKMRKIEDMLAAHLTKNGATSMATTAGTPYFTTERRAKVDDWDEMLEYVRQNEAWGALERRVSKQFVEAHIEATGEPPPGVSYEETKILRVKR